MRDGASAARQLQVNSSTLNGSLPGTHALGVKRTKLMALLRNHLLKQESLLTPVQPGQEGPQAPLGKSCDRRQKKDLFLKVGSEIK